MRVLFLTQSAEPCPASRYRVYQYLPALRAAGIEARVSPAISAGSYLRVYQTGGALRKAPHFAAASLRRILRLLASRNYDVIYFQQWTFPRVYPFVELFASVMNPRMVFDMDEPLYVRPSRRRSEIADLINPEQNVARILKAAAHVVVGNEYLQRFAARHNPRTHLVPTSVDTDSYKPKLDHYHAPPVTIGWIGSFTTTVYLAMLDEVMRALAAEHPIMFRVIGAPYSVQGVRTEWQPWDHHTEASEIARFDIGIMPLLNDEWSRGKSACKALQYMAAGVPALCARNEVTASIITNGVNGFLASTLSDWYDKLSLLIRDAALRKSIGMAGRRTVEEGYSLQVTAPKLIRVLELAAAG